MGCDSPLKGWKDRDTGGITFRRENGFGEKMEVGCGQCLGCRLDYSRMWGMRIAHESAMWEHHGGNCMVTLTYRDKYEPITGEYNEYHVPDNWSLNKKHMTDFFKRLRNFFPDQTIRYFYAGEYGRKCKHGIDLELNRCPLCNCGRPHYHACLFNCSFPDLEPYASDGGIIRYTSPSLEKIWKWGFVDVSDLTFASASYVSGYILKKMGKPHHANHYQHCDLDGVITWIEPEFVIMSRGHRCNECRALGEWRHPDAINCKCTGGIGRDWYHKYSSDLYPADKVPVPGAGVMEGVPRYYDDLLKADNPELYERVKAARLAFMREHGEEYEHGRLLQKHKVKKARTKLKERIL